ncbi:ferritin [Nocardia sp. CNY236]|uniref:ferritin n=1 Tax=Nocardia sp. CNY236 TaxID=1169152 RepID=UPI00042015F6|nr:ferritin-like domain-containing protein [Nocardia sp. CNY236]
MTDTDVTASHPGSSPESFPDSLRAQIRHGFTAAQQYLAAAAYFDSTRLPHLADYAYARSRQHYTNALRIVQYLLDQDLEAQIGGVDEIRSIFDDVRAAAALLLQTEQTCSAQIDDLVRTARVTGDYPGERFVQWFLEEQVHNVAGLTTLLTVIDRAGGELFDVEQFVARELHTRARSENSAPKAAGQRIFA